MVFQSSNLLTLKLLKKNIVQRAFECLEDEDLKPRVTVKFIGEEAVDSGGVTREFFSELFLGFSVHSTLVRGAYPNVTFRHNLEALSKGLFELLGKFVAIAQLNGCPGPHFLTPMAAGFLLDIPQEAQLEGVPEECEFLNQLTFLPVVEKHRLLMQSKNFLNVLIWATQKQL